MPYADKKVALAYARRRYQKDLVGSREKNRLRMQKWRKDNREYLREKWRVDKAADPKKFQRNARRSHQQLMSDPVRLEAKRAYSRAHSKKHYLLNRDKVLSQRMYRAYGLTLAQYKVLLKKQGGGCAICRTTKPKKRAGRLLRFHIDHCHRTKQVRGLLCSNCNVGLGHFKDKPLLLRRAAAYLKI